jgi:transcriptional regulator with XRE-family HTH domain
MTARELAIELGISEAMVSRLLSGDRKPSLGLMIRIRDWTGGAWTLDMQTAALEVGRYGGILRAWMRVNPGLVSESSRSVE